MNIGIGQPGGFTDVPELRFMRNRLAAFISTIAILETSPCGWPAPVPYCAGADRAQRTPATNKLSDRIVGKTSFPEQTKRHGAHGATLFTGASGEESDSKNDEGNDFGP